MEKAYVPKRPFNRYLEKDPFGGDRDIDIRCHTVKIVKVRLRQWCCGLYQRDGHDIEPGTYAYSERAIVEGKWGVSYVCLECLDQYLDKTYDN